MWLLPPSVQIDLIMATLYFSALNYRAFAMACALKLSENAVEVISGDIHIFHGALDPPI